MHASRTHEPINTPRKPIKMPLPSTTASAEEALRRLRDDVAAFRSQEVRDTFFADPVAGDAPPRTKEALEAYVIQLRTALSAATDKMASLDKSLEDASAAAARDRQAAEGLAMQLKAQRVRLEGETVAERERADGLEKKHLDAVASAAENAALLRLASGGAVSEAAEGEAQLAAARAALGVAEPALARARADLAVARKEADETAAVAHEMKSTLESRVHELEREVVSLREGRDASDSKLTAESASSAETVGNLTKENAHLRAENASRAEESLRLREELATVTAQVRDAFAEARRFTADAARVPVLQARIDELDAAERELTNERAVADALREEKAALARLIGALAPSGAARDGLAVLRAAAIRREEGETAEGGDATPKDGGVDALGVSRKEVAEIVARQEAHLRREDELLRQVRELEGQVARGRADNTRNRRMRKVLERERKDLRTRLSEADVGQTGGADAGSQVADAHKAADEYKKLADELMGELHARDEASAANGGQTDEATGSGLHKDLCLLLRMENRDTAVDAARMRDELEKARKERDRAREELAEMREGATGEMDGGEGMIDYDPETTTVWRATESPLSLAFAKASAEGAADPGLAELKEKLRTYVDGGTDGVEGDAEMADVNSRASEIRELLERLTGLEQKNENLRQEAKLGQRRKEAAQRKITEVRGLMRYVFGWDVRPEGASYFMESIYAEDETLQFAVSEANTFSLKSSPYAVEKLADEIEVYLKRQNSIPGLMAKITLGNLGVGDVDMDKGTM